MRENGARLTGKKEKFWRFRGIEAPYNRPPVPGVQSVSSKSIDHSSSTAAGLSALIEAKLF